MLLLGKFKPGTGGGETGFDTHPAFLKLGLKGAGVPDKTAIGCSDYRSSYGEIFKLDSGEPDVYCRRIECDRGEKQAGSEPQAWRIIGNAKIFTKRVQARPPGFVDVDYCSFLAQAAPK